MRGRHFSLFCFSQESQWRTAWCPMSENNCFTCFIQISSCLQLEGKPRTSYTRVCVCVRVSYSCLTLCDPMDSSPPGCSVHGILQARILGWVALSLFPSQGIFPTKGLNIGLLHCRQIPYPLSHQGSPKRTYNYQDMDCVLIVIENICCNKKTYMLSI